MPDRKISQLPMGELTPDSLIPTMSNGVTSHIQFSQILAQSNINDIFITGGSYNQASGVSTFYLNNNTSFNVSGYFTKFTDTPEFLYDKQNSMNYDGSGTKYPTVDTVNKLINNVSLATINTGFIDSNDSFIMSKIDDFTLGFTASNKGIIFKSLLKNSTFTTNAAILNIPTTMIPLSHIGLTNDGIYVRFIGFTDNRQIVYSNTTFKGLSNIAQLGILILKVAGGITSFLDNTRNIINMPSICGYSNLELTALDLQSDVIIKPNTGTMTINSTSGSIKGISVNWHGTNNDKKLINSQSTFTHLSEANALTIIPPALTNIVTTNQYWNGTSLVNLSTSGAATIQRWLVTINGTLALQYGEQEYVDLDTAIDSISTASFIDVLPSDTYVEISRMVAIGGATDLGDINQVVFRTNVNVGSGGETTEAVWGTINGNVNDQRDLFNIFEVSSSSPFIDLGSTKSPITNVSLFLSKNIKVTMTGDTFFNVIPNTEGSESNLILKLPGGIAPNIQFSSNIVWNNGTIPTFSNLDGGKDFSFVGTFSSPQVYTIAMQSDAKILIGGSFTNFNGTALNRLVRANIDGTTDSLFNIGTGFNNIVYNVLQQPDGKILAGGAFTTYNSITANRLVRLNSSGTIDSSFNIGTGFNNTVQIIAIQPDNKILVGGVFTGLTINSLARLNTDGSFDNTFNIGTGFNGTINAIAIQSDNKILCGGGFNMYNGILINRLIRLNSDGSKDTNFNINNGFDSSINSMALQSDGKILVGGGFTSYNPILVYRFLKMNYDGSLDNSFNVGTGFNSTINASAQQSDGKIVIGGSFTQYNGFNINRIIRLNTDGSFDNTFNVGTGFNNTVYSIALQSDGKIVCIGDFTQYSGFNINRIMKLNPDGSRDISFTGATAYGFDATVNYVIIQSGDNKIVVGTNCQRYNNQLTPYLVRLNPDGSKDTTFAFPSLNGEVKAIKQTSTGQLVIGGSFSFGSYSNYVIRLNLDGTPDLTFTAVNGLSSVYSLDLQSDGKVIAGGNFSSAGPRIARLNLDGTKDLTFSGTGAGFPASIVYAVTVQADGKILCGGNFSSFNNLGQNYFVRLNSDGSKDTTFNIGPGANSIPYTFIQSSGETKIFVGGVLTSYGGAARFGLARLNLDGSLDNSFNNGGVNYQSILSLAIQPNGKIVAGGSFLNRIARLNTDGTYDTGFVVGAGFNNTVYAISQQSDGKMVCGGLFTSYNLFTSSRIVRLNPSIEVDYYFKLLQDGPNIIIK